MGQRRTWKQKIPAAVKREVRDRQHDQCATYDPNVCTGVIDEFDHIINIKTLGIDRSQANDPAGIQGLCTPCHTAKTHGAAHRARLTRVLTAGGETPLTCDDDNRARGL